MAKKRGRTLPSHRAEEEAWPELGPEDRMSRSIDYAATVGGYQELVAEEGEAEARESLDYFFYFLDTSSALLAEREFAGWTWSLDPHDYLIYELIAHAQRLRARSRPTPPSQVVDDQVLHIVADGVRRYTTPAIRRALARRANDLARRRAGRVIAAQADAVALAAEDPRLDPALIGQLTASFREALVRAALDLERTTERAWAQHNPALDRWLEEIRAADEAHPAEEAVRRLQGAGAQALPLAEHLAFDEGYECDDYPLHAALRVAAGVPSLHSLWLLREAIAQCPTLRLWAAEQLAARMPELACAYFRFLLTAPEPAEATVAARGLWVLAEARCPGALEVATHSLRYRVDDEAQTEEVQVAAWQALLALDDPAAAPALRAYLADEQADRAGQEELVRALQVRGEGWWQEAIGELSVVSGR